MPHVCRLCLKTNLENYNSIDTDDTRILILSIIPEIDIDVVDRPVICSNCSDELTSAYGFKQNCLKIEERIKKYTENAEGKLILEQLLELENHNENLQQVKEEILEEFDYQIPLEDVCIESSIDDKRKIKIEEKVICKFCNKTFNTIGRRWADHIRTHLKSSFVCVICYEGFKSKSEYLKHRKEIHEPGETRCPICNKHISYKANLARHIENHEKNQEKHYECNFCGLKLKHREKLTEHLRIHTGERPFKCTFCGKTFTQSSTLSTHVRSVHMTERPYVCEICGRTFPVRGAYTGHMNRHKNLTKNYVCSFCGKAYRIESQLKDHVKRHTGVKDYICEVCSKGFVNNTGLTKHMRIHNGDKPFQCHICHKRFTQSYNMKIHIRSCMQRNSGANIVPTVNGE